jgi:hypothetical protein
MGWMDIIGGLGPPAPGVPTDWQALYECGDGPPVCVPTEDPEVSCDDGLDNDCDGMIDGDDPDCATQPVVCSDILDRQACRAEPSCRWDGKNKQCVQN